MTPRILIIEDEIAIRDMLRFALVSAEFEVFEAENTKEAKLKITNQAPQLILLDWMLPDQSGVEFAKQLKTDPLTQEIPIIMLTARAEEDSKVRGLEVGADDYVTKPFSPRELIARIRTVLRRGPMISPENVAVIRELKVDASKHEVKISDRILNLSPAEYNLLYFFITHKNRVYNREQLLHYVWQDALDIDERTVDVHVRRLRRHLEPFQYADLIKTVRGVGYKFGD